MKPLLLAVAATAALGSTLLSPQVFAQSQAEAQVNALEGLAGPQPGSRRSGAKGICASGHFIGNAAGRELSRASVFKGDKIPVVARFSVGGGSPKASDKGKTVRGLALQFQLPGGEQWQMANISAPVFFVSKPEQFAPFVQARTAELERSMRDMEAISYSIAHDLRAPLRSVNGFAQVITEEEGERLSENGRQMFERIARSSRNMGQMITDMLELLRVVRVELEPAPVDMNALAHSVTDSLASDLSQAQMSVLPLPRVRGDATLLRQVLVNLLDNALKYSRHREQPELVLGHDAQKGAFYLRDNGMGFDMARADKLFGLFQRLHAGSDVPGTGVGLAIVARIIERHGGRIWAESEPDVGTTFWWTLPLNT